MKKNEVISIRKYKAGYEIRTEKVLTHFEDKPKGHFYVMKRAYNKRGAYIGTSRLAHILYVKRGIEPQLIKGNKICQIGFCKKENKWYGWSHRAIVGFGIGDRIFEERYGNERTLFIKHGKKTIKNMEDAKLAATRFAKSVS